MSFAVNIIYIRGTVDHLLPFARSLLDNTTCRYRLVSNGCTADERAALMAVAGEYPERVEYVVGSDDGVLSHGEMLERLLEIETEPYFVIGDSDLFAVGPASFDELLPSAEEGGRCSGVPIWHTDTDLVAHASFRRLSGRYIRVANSDVVLGCSYAAAYHTDRVRNVAEHWRVTIGRMQSDDLPEPVRAEFAAAGMEFELYDTLKVVNILHHLQGWPVRLVELPGIAHIGALSQRHREREPPATSWGRVKRRILRATPLLATVRLHQQGLSWHESWVHGRHRARRLATRRYIERLARGEADAADAPAWLRDTAIVSEVQHLYAPTNRGES